MRHAYTGRFRPSYLRGSPTLPLMKCPDESVCATSAAAFVDESYSRMLTSLHQPGGAVAQLGARLDGIEEVVGSNPIGSTNFHLADFSADPRSKI
jgi:hypothetical protein